MAASSSFLKALLANKQAVKSFNAAKKKRPTSGSFEPPDIPSGNYIVKVSLEPLVDSKLNLKVQLRWVVMEGQYAKTSSVQTFWLTGDDPERTQRSWDQLSAAIQILANITDEGIEEFEEWTPAELEQVIKEINSASVLANAYISNKVGNDKVRRVNLYLKSLADEDALEPLDDVESAEEEDTDDEESVKPISTKKPKRSLVKAKKEEEEEEEEEEVEEEEEIEALQKGDYVAYTPPRHKKAVDCQIVKVLMRSKTYSIKEVDGDRTWDDVSWEECDQIEYED